MQTPNSNISQNNSFNLFDSLDSDKLKNKNDLDNLSNILFNKVNKLNHNIIYF